MTITHGYCTLAEIKSRLGIETADTADDTKLESIIEASSRWIDNYCGRVFYATSATRHYTARFGDLLSVDDIVSSGSAVGVTTLKTDDYGDRTYPTTWATTDYDLLPTNGSPLGVPYTDIKLTYVGNNQFPVGVTAGVQIAGVFGYGYTAPPPIKEACLLASMRLFKRKDAVFGVVGSGEWARVLPKDDPDIVAMLAPYKRLEVW
jgi:hypothetical protein